MPRDEADALLSVAQAATLLGVHPNTIRAWTDAGRLTAYRINARGDRRFRRRDVERILVEDGPVVAGPEIAREPAQHRAHVVICGRIAAGMASNPSPQAVARTLVESMRTEVQATSAAVYLALDGGELELAAHAGFATPPPSRRPLPADDRIVDGDHVDHVLRTRSEATGLLRVNRGAVESLGPGALESLAATASAALGAARLISRARAELERARALGLVSKELAGELDLTRVLDHVIERTRTLFGAHHAGLWLFDDTEHPVSLVTRNLSDAFLARSAALTPDSETIGVRAMQEGRAQWVRNAHRDEAVGEMRTAYRDEGIRTVCIVPLIRPGGALGVLGLYHDDDRSWPTEEINLAQSFADQAAIAIQNARLYRSVAEQAARMRSIQDLSARLNRLTDVRAIAEAIVAEASTLAEYHDIRIYRIDWERGVCDPIAFTREMLDGDPADAEALLRVKIGEGFTGWVAEHGEPLLINDALDDDRGMTIEGTDDVPESMLLVPMLYEGRSLGVIVLSQLGYHRFSDDDLQTMRIFAGYAAQAMANADSYERMVAQSEELSRRADSQRRLLEINERLLSTLDQAGVLETIADGLRDVVVYDNLSIYRADTVKRVMQPVLARERHADEVRRYLIPFGQGLMGWAVEHSQPILANDALSDPRALQIPGTPDDPEAIVVVPLIADGEVLGALNVSRVGGPEVHFSESDFELVQLFAAQASIALRNADAHHAMSQRAETDALTGLGNHGAFQRDLGRYVERATVDGVRGRDGRLAVLMMDLDNFKAYNDRHGHPAGDALLHRTATAIFDAVRTDDRVYRYGGDEFALILPGATAVEAARVGQRVRRAVAALTAEDQSPVTITVGVGGLPADAADRAGLIAAADTALYYGKRAGENRVIRADQLASDVGDLRGTLEELAAAALREGNDEHAVEHLVEHATQLTTHHDEQPSLREALLTIARSFDVGGVAGRGHADRVARLAGTIATRLKLSDDALSAVELAARLHALDERGLADLRPIASLRGVADIVAGYRSLLAAGSRRSRRLARANGSVAAHIVATADMYDELVAGVGRRRVSRGEALELLRADPATFRADVLATLTDIVERRAAGPPKASRSTVPEEARGAA